MDHKYKNMMVKEHYKWYGMNVMWKHGYSIDRIDWISIAFPAQKSLGSREYAETEH